MCPHGTQNTLGLLLSPLGRQSHLYFVHTRPPRPRPVQSLLRGRTAAKWQSTLTAGFRPKMTCGGRRGTAMAIITVCIPEGVNKM